MDGEFNACVAVDLSYSFYIFHGEWFNSSSKLNFGSLEDFMRL